MTGRSVKGMPDREKVIYDIERCICHVPDACRDCSHFYEGRGEVIGCMEELLTDALALLKEQEAVKPEVEVLNEIDRLYKCPRCHKHFFYEKQKYCDQCGQAVKWE